MWTARVVLFFRCTFRRPGVDTRIPCTLALVNRLRPFTLQNARKSSANHLGWRVEPELCVAQRDLFREGTCPFCMSVIQSKTFESFLQRTSSTGLVWLRAFWMAYRNTTPFLTGFNLLLSGFSMEERQTRLSLAVRGVSSMS